MRIQQIIVGLALFVVATTLGVLFEMNRHEGHESATPLDVRAPSKPQQVDEPGSDRARLENLENEVERLSRELANLRTTRGDMSRVPVNSGAEEAGGPMGAEPESSTPESLDHLSEHQLLSEARRLGREEPLAAQRHLEALLERTIPLEQRVPALALLGQIHRKAGDLVAAERALEEAVASGAGTDDGAWASYELALTLSARGDDLRALDLIKTTPETPHISVWNRRHAEWAVATLMAKTGDTKGARARFSELVETCKDDEEFAWLAAKARKQLADLQ